MTATATRSGAHNGANGTHRTDKESAAPAADTPAPAAPAGGFADLPALLAAVRELTAVVKARPGDESPGEEEERADPATPFPPTRDPRVRALENLLANLALSLRAARSDCQALLHYDEVADAFEAARKADRFSGDVYDDVTGLHWLLGTFVETVESALPGEALKGCRCGADV